MTAPVLQIAALAVGLAVEGWYGETAGIATWIVLGLLAERVRKLRAAA